MSPAGEVGAGATMVPVEGWAMTWTGAIVRFTPPENDFSVLLVPVASAKGGQDAAAQA